MGIARDVVDLNGRVLLTKGAKITPKHVKIFKVWGIPEVCIEGGPESTTNEGAGKNAECKRLEEIKNELQTVFCHNDLDHPFIKELFSICLERQQNNLPGK